MNEPTEAQIKEFWEKCGLYYKDYSVLEAANSCEAMCMDRPISGWYDSKGKLVSFKTVPVVDFNNLFKYAEFKAVVDIGVNLKISIDKARKRLFECWLENIKKVMSRPNALFWAIKESL